MNNNFTIVFMNNRLIAGFMKTNFPIDFMKTSFTVGFMKVNLFQANKSAFLSNPIIFRRLNSHENFLPKNKTSQDIYASKLTDICSRRSLGHILGYTRLSHY